jgi:hypothetical protein
MRLETFTFQQLAIVKHQKGMDVFWIKVASRYKGKEISMSSVRTRGERLKLYAQSGGGLEAQWGGRYNFTT